MDDSDKNTSPTIIHGFFTYQTTGIPAKILLNDSEKQQHIDK